MFKRVQKIAQNCVFFFGGTHKFAVYTTVGSGLIETWLCPKSGDFVVLKVFQRFSRSGSLRIAPKPSEMDSPSSVALKNARARLLTPSDGRDRLIFRKFFGILVDFWGFWSKSNQIQWEIQWKTIENCTKFRKKIKFSKYFFFENEAKF